jgi:hypothetical protein
MKQIIIAQETAEFQLKYSSIFPNKNTLQLKIREVRQKLMSTTPTTPNSSSLPTQDQSFQSQHEENSRDNCANN